MKRAAAISLVLFFACVACKPPQIYEWGNYEGALYGLMKDPVKLEKYGQSLQKQIQDGEASGKVPPGIYAEYGYVLMVSKQPKDATHYFEKEKQHWPESTRFMDKMILNCGNPRPLQSAPQPAAASAVTTAQMPAKVN
jgi:hypothetical protein